MTIIGVDTGGTFTDFVVLRDGAVSVRKVASTPDDPARAVLEGLRMCVGEGERFTLVHGSTVATNALLERRGARVALVTNAGFEDVLEIGRQNRPRLYALSMTREPPLVARADRHGVRGRIAYDGAELEPLDARELDELPGRVAGAEAIAICLLHGYANAAHEEAVGRALAEAGVHVSLSSRVLPQFREYERTATTVANAYVAPVTAGYLDRIQSGAGAQRIRIMGSSGGSLSVVHARAEPVHTILSGPAGGVAGALACARATGHENVLAFDMGGTSTDVSLIAGRPLHTRELVVAYTPIALPMLDIHTVGAGGGSYAWVDAGGALKVGPRSAGAVPGPIAYGADGDRVTVTDAHVWLGRLPEDALLGGERRLERERIAEPLEQLARALGCDADTAAEGILTVADTAMETALRVVSVARGFDPADFALVPFGGAGGLHACALAERLGVRAIVLPPDPGVLSALGMLVAPPRRESARTVLLPAERRADIERVLAELRARATGAMEEDGFDVAALRIDAWVEARYEGQSYELTVPASEWVAAFHDEHARRYGYARPDAAVEAVTLRVDAEAASLPLPRITASVVRAPERDTEVVHGGRRIRARTLPRAAVHARDGIEGPAILLDYSATAWLAPGWRAVPHASGSLTLTRS